MRIQAVLFTLFCTILLQVACHCRLIECEGDWGMIEISIVKNGKNALFGPDAFINKDSIIFSNQNNPVDPAFVSFRESSQTVNLYIENGQTYVLEIKNIRVDTIIGHMITTGIEDCCEGYAFTDVMINGQTVCQNGCNEVIEIRL